MTETNVQMYTSIAAAFSDEYSIHDRYYSQVEFIDAAIPVDDLPLNDFAVRFLLESAPVETIPAQRQLRHFYQSMVLGAEVYLRRDQRLWHAGKLK